MTYKTGLSMAWLSFVGIILGELIVDYLIRINSDDFYHSGIPEQLWFVIQMSAAALALFFVFRSAKLIDTRSRIVIHYALNISLGVLFYTVVVFFYIVGLGIDSL